MGDWPLTILGAGMMTGVGLSAPAASAAIRCGINNFQETRFIDKAGEWILGSEVPLDQPWRGEAKLVKLLAGALRECLDLAPKVSPEEIPVLLCVAETSRPGRLEGAGNLVFSRVQEDLRLRFSEESQVIAEGRVGGATALREARKLLYRPKDPVDRVILAGVDSYLVGPTLNAYGDRDRVLSAANSDGFIPGEAGGAILLGRPEAGEELRCVGFGFGREEATVESEEPLRADGLIEAITAALADAGLTLGDMDYRLTDLSGEQYGFKEAELAITRTLREHKEAFDIWHPADSIGEVGAAALPCMLGVALAAAAKGFDPGPIVLCHLGNDDGARAALVLRRGAGAT
jgi:3-oxoacyl-[acyl-carrier-protein] synthase-1